MRKKSKALFLDRDGVINVNHGYVYEIKRFEFIKEIFPIMKIAQAQQMPIIIITNQSGIGRGIYTEDQFEELSNWMKLELENQGIYISGVFHCSDNPDNPHFSPSTSRRKPSPAMFIEAANELGIDLENSIMIGDNDSDLAAAKSANLRHRILISKATESQSATHIVKDHLECKDRIIEILNVGLERS